MSKPTKGPWVDKYISSLINKYGDRDKVPQDCKTLYEIIGRQGTSLLIDCIAEHAGTNANNFKMSPDERQRLIDVLVAELKSALEERL